MLRLLNAFCYKSSQIALFGINNFGFVPKIDIFSNLSVQNYALAAKYPNGCPFEARNALSAAEAGAGVRSGR